MTTLMKGNADDYLDKGNVDDYLHEENVDDCLNEGNVDDYLDEGNVDPAKELRLVVLVLVVHRQVKHRVNVLWVDK